MVTAEAVDEDADVTILNGVTPVTNGASASWALGANTLTITVDIDGVETAVYTVRVTRIAGT